MPARASLLPLSLAAVLVSLLVSSGARAEVPLLDGFGGTVDYGSDCLGSNDDGSSRAIDLTSIWPSGLQFFDRTHTQMFVNTNGNVSFTGQVPTYTPSAFPVADQPLIAPFWADVDIRSGGDCPGAGGGTGYAGDCENPGENGVWWAVDVPNRRIVVTWDRVGYYNCRTDKDMSFQLVLTAVDAGSCGGGGDFDVEFRFQTCEWNTGDASGGENGLVTSESCGLFGICPIDLSLPCSGGRCSGVAGQAGFDAGNSTDFVEIMGSRSNTIHTTLCTDSNVGTPGLWQFQIRSGVVVCPDAGDPCDTGESGVCATGRTQCVGGGTECRQEVEASMERCDALDNDCDGSTDEGDSLCAAGEVCQEGVCVGNCFEGGCTGGLTCDPDSGQCVEADCVGVDCPEGQRCLGGECVGACDGVTCPPPLSCRAGSCVDLCAGAVCDDCTVCVEGVCETRCQFTPCPGGETCQPDGTCIESACDGVSCGAGEVCDGGSCVDACAGAMCPMGQMCETGRCVAIPMTTPDAGPPPPMGDGGVVPMPDGGGMVPVDAGVPMETDAGPRTPGRGAEPGCSCRAPGEGDSSPFGLVLAGLVLAVFLRRRP